MFMASLGTKIGAVLLAKQVQGFKKKLDASEVGGALLLGIRRPVIKAHGNSDGKAFKNAIRQAMLCCEHGVVEEITACLAKEGEEE